MKRSSRGGSRRGGAPESSAELKLIDSLVTAWPGPAAALAADGRVRVANPAAAPVLGELASRMGGEIGRAHV